jgi:hypothetical protein
MSIGLQYVVCATDWPNNVPMGDKRINKTGFRYFILFPVKVKLFGKFLVPARRTDRKIFSPFSGQF